VIVLYALGLTLVTVDGLVVPLLVGVTREDPAASERRATGLESELANVRHERDQFEAELDEERSARTGLQATLDTLGRSQSRFELYQDRGGQWCWRLRHRNGNVIVDGGEGYTRRHNAQNGVQAVRRDALGASVMLVEAEDALPRKTRRSTPSKSTTIEPISNCTRTRKDGSAGDSATATVASPPTAARGTRTGAGRSTASRA
jgi:uncharacterized protein YegP (UPF0339 family)